VDIRTDDTVFSSPSNTFNGGEAIIFLDSAGPATSLIFTASQIANIHSQTRIGLESDAFELNANFFRFEADNAIEVTSTTGIVATSSGSLSVLAGIEQPVTSRIGFAAGLNVGFSASGAATSSLYVNSEDNIVTRSLNSLTISSTFDVNMIADYGSQLYYATLTAPNFGDENFIIRSVDGDIEITVYGELRHRQAIDVAFFTVNPGTNPGAETIDINVWTNFINPTNWANNGPTNVATSPCVWIIGGNQGIFDCPEAAARAYQLALALDNYGLMNIQRSIQSN